MQKSDSGQLTTAHRRVKGSTTLNRKYVRRPVVASNAVKVRMQQVRPAETKTKATVSQQQRKLTASELRDLAIKKALAEADNYSEQDNTQTKMAESIKMDNEKKTSSRKGEFSAKKVRFGIGRVFLAFGCAVAVVVGIVYLVNANMPDISLKVAAMQTGIDNPYPSYVPRDYNVSDVVSEIFIIKLHAFKQFISFIYGFLKCRGNSRNAKDSSAVRYELAVLEFSAGDICAGLCLI